MRKFSGLRGAFAPVAIIHYSGNNPRYVRAYNGREWQDDLRFPDVYSTFRAKDSALMNFIARYTGVRVPTCVQMQDERLEYACRYVGACTLKTKAAINRLEAATEFCGLSLAGAEPVPVRGDMAAYLWQHSGLAEAFWLCEPAKFSPTRYYTFALDCGGTSYVRRVGGEEDE